jgi:hypothetical protein
MSKRIVRIALSIILCASLLTACGETPAPVKYDSLSDLSNAVGFNVVNPIDVPDGYALAGYYAVGENLAQIAYVNGDNELIFAMTTLEKVECDLGTFDETKTAEVNGVGLELNFLGGSVHLAVARTGGYSYAIYSKNGLSEEEMIQLAGGMGLEAQK